MFLNDAELLKLDRQCADLARTTFATIFGGLQFGSWEEMVGCFGNGTAGEKDVKEALARQAARVSSGTGLRSGATTPGARGKSAAGSDVGQKRGGRKDVEEVDPSEVSALLGTVPD